MATKKSTPRFSTQSRIVLPGSEKQPLLKPGETGRPEIRASGSAAPVTGRITVSVIVRRRQPLPTRDLPKLRLTRVQLNREYGADPRAIKLVRAFAAEFGLKEERSDPATDRIIRLSGSPAAMQKAFGVELSHQKLDGDTYRVREGSIHLPAELEGSVEAVLGLDNRPQASPHFRVAKGAAAHASPAGTNAAMNAASTSFTPVQIAQLYQFPANASASGQTIGIIELGGGYRTADIAAYFKSIGRPAPKVTAVSVDKGKNAPSDANGPDAEVMLDIEVAAGVAPGARVVVYFAPNTDQGFIDAIATAVHDNTNKPGVISISWGAPESSWTMQSMNALDAACQSAAAVGVTVTVASGDNGSTDGATGNNVDFPASSPHVLACGGTKLVGSGGSISSEVVWNELAASEGATGGGVSAVFAKPSWQLAAKVPAPPGAAGGRGVPDVAGDADPTTGYVVRVDGQSIVIGGTSAVAPLWAGLIAVANAQNKRSAGLIQPAIYAAKAKSAFRDITSGNNGAFSAGPGWDPCTGLGTPITTKLIPILAGSTPGKKATKKVPTKAPVRSTSKSAGSAGRSAAKSAVKGAGSSARSSR